MTCIPNKKFNLYIKCGYHLGLVASAKSLHLRSAIRA